jgi:EAL domain-containing protein (putative c-di-GMP-specific phosphodiesterase class I)
LDLVRVLGCDKVQGHVFGPSLSRQAAEALMMNNRSLTVAAQKTLFPSD